MHRELSALAGGTSNQTEAQQGGRQRRQAVLRRPGIKVVETHHTGVGAEGDHPHQQEHITNPLGEEGISRCGDHQRLGIPEANQEIGRQGEHLQQEIALKQRVAEHNATHGALKKAEQGEETGQGPLLVHVPKGIHLGQQAEACDQLQGHQIGERQAEADVQLQISHREPGEGQIRRTELDHLLKNQAAVGKGHECQQDVEVGSGPMGIAAKGSTGPGQGHQHPGKSVERDQPGGLDGKRELRSQNGERDGNRAGR